MAAVSSQAGEGPRSSTVSFTFNLTSNNRLFRHIHRIGLFSSSRISSHSSMHGPRWHSITNQLVPGRTSTQRLAQFEFVEIGWTNPTAMDPITQQTTTRNGWKCCWIDSSPHQWIVKYRTIKWLSWRQLHVPYEARIDTDRIKWIIFWQSSHLRRHLNSVSPHPISHPSLYNSQIMHRIKLIAQEYQQPRISSSNIVQENPMDGRKKFFRLLGELFLSEISIAELNMNLFSFHPVELVIVHPAL